MKKQYAAALSAVIFASLASCSSPVKPDSRQTDAVCTEITSLDSVSYRKQSVTLPERFSILFALKAYNGGESVLIGGMSDNSPVLYTADSACKNFSKQDISYLGLSDNFSVSITEDGKIIILSIQNTDDKTALRICTLDTANGDTSEVFADFPENTITADTYLSCSVTDGRTIIVSSADSYLAFGIDGSFIGKIETGSDLTHIESIGRGSDNKLYCAVRKDEDTVMICTFDAEKCRIGKSVLTVSQSGFLNREMSPAYGDGILYFSDSSSEYTFNNDGSAETVFSFASAGINSDNGIGFVRNGEEYIVPINNSSSAELARFTQMSTEEAEELPVLKLGCYAGDNSSDFCRYAKKVISSADNCRIEIFDYSQYSSDGPFYFDALSRDIISGNAPDILMTDGLEYMKLDEKGMYADLTDFLENDTEFGRECFNQHILDVCTADDGCLYELPMFCTFRMAVGKTDLIGEQSGSSFIDIMTSPPSAFTGNITRSDMDTYEQWKNFVDLKTGKVTLDCDEFVDYLEYCRSLSEESFKPETDEFSQWFYNDQMQFNNNEKLLYINNYSDFYSYFEMKHGLFGGDDITVVGTPQLAVFTKLAISDKCADKELAWSVMKQFYADEMYSADFFYPYSEPVTESAVLTHMDESFTRSNYLHNKTDEGWLYDLDFTDDGSFEDMQMGFPTDEDKAEYLDILHTAEYKLSAYPDELYAIYNDEISRFFAGECSAYECASAMKSRMEIYLSEQA